MSVTPVSGPVYLFNDITKSKEIKSYDVKKLMGGSNLSTQQFDTINDSSSYKRERLFDAPSDGYYENNIVYWKTTNVNLPAQDNSDMKSSQKSFIQQMTELEDVTASTTTSHGTRIIFMSGFGTANHEKMNSVKVERTDGLNVIINLKRNARINEDDDGSLSIYYPETQEMQILDKDGYFHSTILDGENSEGTDGDDIFISIQGGRVDVGNGNNTVINAADNAYIYAGDGDNHIINLNLVNRNINIKCGNGNNIFDMKGINNSLIMAGNGNNIISGGLNNSQVSFGDGNNTLYTGIYASDISLGTGNNCIETNYCGGSINSGEGILKIKCRTLNSLIKAEGNFEADTWSIGGQIEVTGNTRLAAQSAGGYGFSLLTGDGDDDIYINSGHGTINTGGGNDSVSISSWMKGTVNGKTFGPFDELVGDRLRTAFTDPFFSPLDLSGFSSLLTSASTISR